LKTSITVSDLFKGGHFLVPTGWLVYFVTFALPWLQINNLVINRVGFKAIKWTRLKMKHG